MHRIELIEWADAGGDESDHTWSSADDVSDDNPIIQSVGWVVKETARNITLAMDLADDGQTHTRSRVPVGMVISRKVLFETKES